ncbi:hypothetical protein HID58_006518 [Brassica napus]|uniref:Uncharacterized protein n=1 Tax=Brassica napus TaxID=3708 RepID=A0ABQ8EBL7_BRANA|nr:hypothetical protein HID58_006518 [Brassica napus]
MLAVLSHSASFQTLPFGLINADSDCFILVVVTYSGMHLMIFNSSPAVEQVSLVNFVISCYAVLSCIMVFIKPSKIPPKLKIGLLMMGIKHLFLKGKNGPVEICNTS